mmetsp:Transcript_69438/g.162628  ORF Transcript_69438/g.162628 Transcript_69438/m.162628 type:complete len:235 (+) Transcript_69438:118-822(+)
MIWSFGHGVRMCLSTPGGNSWWRTSPVSVHSHRQGVCSHTGQRGAQGKESAADLLPAGPRGTFRCHRRISRPCSPKRRTKEVSMASLAGTHRMECPCKARMVREDHAQSSGQQDRGSHRKRSRQDLSRHRRFRRQEEARTCKYAPSTCRSFSQRGLLPRHELRCRLSATCRWKSARRSKGCIFPARANDDQVPGKPLVLRWSSASQASYISIPRPPAAAFSRCPPTFLGKSNYA